MSETKSQQLRGLQYTAVNELRNAESMRDSQIRELVREFESKTSARIHAEWEARIDELRNAAQLATIAADEATVAEVREGGSIFPLGTKMIEWGTEKYAYRGSPLKPTGKSGVVEVIDRNSTHPANRNWSRASVGHVVIRIAKKDGSLGTNYVTAGWNQFGNWHPEGVDPNLKEKTA